MFAFFIFLLAALPATLGKPSTKRGLVYIPSKKYPGDDSIWQKAGSDLTWYYNYGPRPSQSLSSSRLQFIPMLWGKPASTETNSFSSTVKSLVDSGQNISFALGFNEPDGQGSTGGSSISPEAAASIWKTEMEPVRELGIELGAPAVTGSPRGLQWMDSFLHHCSGKCTIDFIPVHWYGNFEGLASHLGQIRGKFKDKNIWVTEYALSHGSLKDSQTFYNQSADYFDRIDYVTRYSYFGSFRSDASNIGPGAAMLTQNGRLTDIGSWYLGGSATGAVPKGASARYSPFYLWPLAVGLLCAWGMI